MSRPGEAAGVRKRGLFQRLFHSEASGSVLLPVAAALGVLALPGPRAPLDLKVFLTVLAIADDLGAELVIAVFYMEKVNLAALRGRLDRLEWERSPGRARCGTPIR